MANIPEQIRAEHRNMRRLLGVLEQELARFEGSGQPDYDVLLGLANYFAGFPERCHHPKEDFILNTLRHRDPVAAAAVGDLEAEHKRLAALARAFREAVENVLLQEEVSRAAFTRVARHFIAEQDRHMRMEEEFLLGAAQNAFTSAEWAMVEQIARKENDPVFDTRDRSEFARLYANVMRWEQGTRT